MVTLNPEMEEFLKIDIYKNYGRYYFNGSARDCFNVENFMIQIMEIEDFTIDLEYPYWVIKFKKDIPEFLMLWKLDKRNFRNGLAKKYLIER